MTPYLTRFIRGVRTEGGRNEHYWRWPVMLHVRPIRRHGVWLATRVSIHGIRDGVVRGSGPFHPAVRTFVWIGPLCIEFGWRRQAIEDWRWRRRLRRSEEEPG